MKLRYFFLGILFSVVLLSLAVTSYYFGKSTITADPIAVPSEDSIPTLAITPTPEPLNPETVRQVISSAIRNENYVLLSDFLENPVSFRIENSVCCNPQTASQAITQLEYLKSTEGTWNFDQEGEVVKSLAASYPEHYSNAYIGLTSDFYSVAFQFSADGKISKISISASYKLLLQ
jgi:hypothetical protein